MTERDRMGAAEGRVAERMLALQAKLHVIHEALPALSPDHLTEAAATCRDAAAAVSELALELAAIAREILERGRQGAETTLPLFPDRKE